MTREDTAERALSTGLGLFSIGLGLAELAIPEKFSKTLGAKKGHSALVRSFGAREMAAGMGLLAQKRPLIPMASRVAGDLVHLGALLQVKRKNGTTVAAAAAVLGVMALDVFGTWLLAKKKAEEADALLPNFIINKPIAEVKALHTQLSIGDVRFEPYARNTTRAWTHSKAPNAREELRKFKQLVETGEIPTTEGQPHGPRSLVGKVVERLEQ